MGRSLLYYEIKETGRVMLLIARTTVVLIVVIGLCVETGLFHRQATAQTTSPVLNGQLNPTPVPSATTPAPDATTPASLSIASPVTAGAVSTDQSSSLGKSFGSAGQGLPGMPGGAPINSALGAQDPSGKYMRPPVIPPILCDPAIDIPC